MRVELPLAPIEQQVDSRLKSVGRTAKIKGFRPGKVPPKQGGCGCEVVGVPASNLRWSVLALLGLALWRRRSGS